MATGKWSDHLVDSKILSEFVDVVFKNFIKNLMEGKYEDTGMRKAGTWNSQRGN